MPPTREELEALERVTPAQLATLLQSSDSSSPLVVDVRDEDFELKGYIRGAVHLPKENFQLDEDVDARVCEFQSDTAQDLPSFPSPRHGSSERLGRSDAMGFVDSRSPPLLIPRPPLKHDATGPDTDSDSDPDSDSLKPDATDSDSDSDSDSNSDSDSDVLKTDPTNHSADLLLPAMSTEHSPLMPRLMPTTTAPSLPSSSSAPLAFLESVDHIEINETVERDGVTYYIVDVFLQHYSSRIPTNKSKQTRLSNVQPDYRIEHRFNDFADLRYQVWNYAQRKHEGSTTCTYCDEYMHFIVYSMSQPRLLVKIATGVGKRKQLLATFCNEFIAMATGSKMTSRRPRNFTCDGYQAIPHIMDRFIRMLL